MRSSRRSQGVYRAGSKNQQLETGFFRDVSQWLWPCSYTHSFRSAESFWCVLDSFGCHDENAKRILFVLDMCEWYQFGAQARIRVLRPCMKHIISDALLVMTRALEALTDAVKNLHCVVCWSVIAFDDDVQTSSISVNVKSWPYPETCHHVAIVHEARKGSAASLISYCFLDVNMSIKFPSCCECYKYSESFKKHLEEKHPLIALVFVAHQTAECFQSNCDNVEDFDERYYYNNDNDFDSPTT